MNDTTGYFVLSDGSLWKAIPFATRYRSLSEWWNDVQLVPENYECVPNDWMIGSQVEVYSKYGNLNINQSDASNEYALRQCTHLLVNSHTGQVLFAAALNPAEGIMRLFTEAKAEGYSSGHSSGYLQGYSLGASVNRCHRHHLDD